MILALGPERLMYKFPSFFKEMYFHLRQKGLRGVYLRMILRLVLAVLNIAG